MLCAIAKLDPAASERLMELAKLTDSFGIPSRNVYGHITLATYVGDDEDRFISSCKAVLSGYEKFSICFDKIEVFASTSMIAAVPRAGKTIAAIQAGISRRWAADLNEWTRENVWQPHTTLVYDPHSDLEPIAKIMREKLEPFAAQVDRIEFSRVYENGYEIIDFIELR